MRLPSGCGRLVAPALLCVLTVLQCFPEQSPWQFGQRALFDAYQRLMPRQPVGQPVTLVEIDEASLKQIGQWPWPRNRTAELIDAIAAHGPLAIGLDLYMPERDQTSPAQVADNLPPGQDTLAAALRALPSHEAQLARALACAPTVLAAAGFDYPTLSTRAGLRSMPLQQPDGEMAGHLRRFPYVLASLPLLQAAARGQALVSADPQDGVVRRVPLVAAVSDQVVPGLALEMLRVAAGASAIVLRGDVGGVRAAEVAGLRVPLQDNGELWLHFASASASRYVSAAEVLAGRADPALFRDKLVLLGLTGLGLSDRRVTPLRDTVPGVDIQAQVIESVLEQHFLRRPAWLHWAEVALLVGAGLFLLWAVPRLRPRLATLLASMLAVLLFGGGMLLFRYAGLLFDAASLFAGLNIVFGSLLSNVFIDADRQRRSAQRALARQREASARVAGELAAARRIQFGSLPQAERLFAGERRFELAALLEPAREVGGDFYDFFMVDAHRLFFIIGDVSGKGLPASLFMAVSKSLAKSAALRPGMGLADMIATANRETSRENPENLFVTAVAGLLDADSGELELCVAGHDAPWRVGAQAALRLQLDGGPPLCVLDDFPYPVGRSRLAPGEALVLHTDGVTEALDAQGSQYGSQRLAAVLARTRSDAHGLRDALHADVRRFVGSTEASDDLTLLVLRYTGPAA